MRPVLLLDVRVVVLLVRTPPRKLNVLLLAPALQMLVDELRAVVGIHSAQSKGPLSGDFVSGPLYGLFAPSQHRPRFGPGRVDIGHVERVREFSARRIEQVARLSSSVNPPPLPRLRRWQPPLDLPRTDFPQLPLDFWPHPIALANPGPPRRQQRFQPYRPGIARHRPHRRQYRQSFLFIAHPSTPGRPSLLLRRRPV